MIIGLDIDGTITRHPEFFAFVSQALICAGHEVIVVTFRQDRESATLDLAEWGISYSRLVTWDPALWGHERMLRWKGEVCRDLNIGVLFEDDPQVLSLVHPETVSMMVVDHEVHPLQRLAD